VTINPESMTLRRGDIPSGGIERHASGDAVGAADHVRNSSDRVSDQISIFSAISIASSTSMPRYQTVLSIFECPSRVAPF